ncbi:MAG: hypothetical protein KDJ17_10100 [Hyphomicrobiaceae bacterium]|nr:hypothetical protein [Hyphomicrobiaceae bacterium]
MLSNIFLIVLQFAGAYLLAPSVLRFIPVSGDLRFFVHAGTYALIVWIIGLAASFVLKDVPQRSGSSFAASLLFAMIGAALVIFAPNLIDAIPLKFPNLYVPLILAIVGYFMRR